MPEAITSHLSAQQVASLNDFARRINKLDANIFAFDMERNCILSSPAGRFESDQDQLKTSAIAVDCKSLEFELSGDYSEIIAITLNVNYQPLAIVVIDTGDLGRGDVEDLRRFCSQNNLDYQLVKNAAYTNSKDAIYFGEMLNSFASEFATTQRGDHQVEMMGTQLSQAYEELSLLYNMSTNMKVTESNSTYLQMACDQVTNIINVEGIAIFLKGSGLTFDENQFILAAGSGMVSIDCVMADILQLRLIEELHSGREALLDSQVDSPFKYDWPKQVKNLIAVPLHGGSEMIGFLVATNIVAKPDFDTIEIKLFNSVANQCAIFVENQRLFGDLKELFIGSLKSLTNSIDAKDQYTRGHSERVAYISRWLAEKVAKVQPISEEQIHKIYLSGLLHDIGKIGINESVLCKKGKLDADERSQIEGHPKIGANILGDIKQMNEIVPGIVSHHERADGKGYPNGLKGDQIPLAGKIIALADTFDAMTSRRVYRDAMSIKRAITLITENVGTQFDAEIGEIFINSDLIGLWKTIQDGFIETWDYSNFDEYGAAAVGTLIR